MNKTIREKEQRKELGRVTLSEKENLIITLVDEEKLDIRVWMDSERYKGPTKRGVRFYIYDDIWPRVFELFKTFNKEYEELD